MNGLNHVFSTVPSSSAKEILTLELQLDTDSLCTKGSISLKKTREKLKTLTKLIEKKQATKIKDKLCPDICPLWPHSIMYTNYYYKYHYYHHHKEIYNLGSQSLSSYQKNNLQNLKLVSDILMLLSNDSY